MKPRIRGIQIPCPCTVDWESMDSITSEERFCSRCAHGVTDFSGKTDREILELLLANEGRVCGRFTKTQLERLNRSLQPKPRRAPWRAALLTLAGIACTVPPATATEPEPEPLAIPFEAAEEAIADMLDEAVKEGRIPQFSDQEASGTPAFVGGRVWSAHGGTLSGVQVKVATTDISTTTESEGWFYIDLSQLKDDLPREVTLEFSYDGYRPQETTISTGGYTLLFMVEEGWVSGHITLIIDDSRF